MVPVAERYGTIDSWDVSRLTDFSLVFHPDRNSYKDADLFIEMTLLSPFNEDISSWNTSNAVTMEGLLAGCTNFTGNLSSWDMSRVTTLKAMFHSNKALDVDVGAWDVSLVSDFSFCFYQCSSDWSCGVQTLRQI